MRVLKKEKIMKEVVVTLEDYNLCDKCNCEIKKDDIYDAFECKVLHRTGEKYPEGWNGEKQEVELCQKCAVDLIELLRLNGYRITDSEWDW
jgi:hypothetical protein